MQLEEKNAQLMQINAELASFSYVASHDLKEPLRKIQSFSDRILEKEADRLSESGRDYFGRMQKAAARMDALIEDLLAYSRTNNTDRTFEITHLNKILDLVKADLREELTQKKAVIETSGMCDVSIIPFQFRQIFYNLISNSLKFSRSDAPPVISINCKIENASAMSTRKVLPDKKYCHISVQDNGIGFEQQYSKKIFELFQRLHGRTKYTGTGIGLAIVKKIVENHHGMITAHGEPGQGARFDIFIPADNQHSA
jgi:signal transduction histidine kinase